MFCGSVLVSRDLGAQDVSGYRQAIALFENNLCAERPIGNGKRWCGQECSGLPHGRQPVYRMPRSLDE
jgi:hypothetical protein